MCSPAGYITLLPRRPFGDRRHWTKKNKILIFLSFVKNKMIETVQNRRVQNTYPHTFASMQYIERPFYGVEMNIFLFRVLQTEGVYLQTVSVETT